MTDRLETNSRPRKERARATNHLFALDGVHRQSEIGRRYEDLARGFVAALGGEPGMTEAQRTAVRRAAELATLAEQQRGRALRGEPVDPLALVRLEGAAARAMKALGIKAPSDRGPTLKEYLAARQAPAPPVEAGG